MVKRTYQKRLKRFIHTVKVLCLSALLFTSLGLVAQEFDINGEFVIPITPPDPVSDSGQLTLETILKAGTIDGLRCMDLSLKGTCFWYRCTWTGCSFKTTLIITHYIPDVIVQVYDKPGDAPFELSNILTSVISFALGSEASGSDRSSSTSHNIIARNSDVTGSPAAMVVARLLSELPLGLSCEPGSTAMQPYFVSGSNPLFWYSGIIDTIANYDELLNGRFVGERIPKPFNRLDALTHPNWGNTFPRTGMVVHQDHYRGSAVIANRSMDLVFDPLIGLYQQDLEPSNGKNYVPSMKVQESNEDEGYWQMLYPTYEKECHIFGDLGTFDGLGLDGFSSRRGSTGDYAWHYWRKYKCCQKPRRYRYITKIEW